MSRSRLSGGLVIALDKPDRDTRLRHPEVARGGILRATSPTWCCRRACWNASPTWMMPSPRELIGVFTKLATYADLTKKPVTLGDGRRSGRPARRPGRQDLDRGHPAQDRRVLQARRQATSIRRSAPAASPGRARWRCIWRASSPRARCPRSAAASAAATTPRCCMPAAASRR